MNIKVLNYKYYISFKRNTDRFKDFQELESYCYWINHKLSSIAYKLDEQNICMLKFVPSLPHQDEGYYNHNNELVEAPDWIQSLIDQS